MIAPYHAIYTIIRGRPERVLVPTYYRRGDWAVRRLRPGRHGDITEGWAVTHLPSGRAVALVDTARQARAWCDQASTLPPLRVRWGHPADPSDPGARAVYVLRELWRRGEMTYRARQRRARPTHTP